jgi:subtilisin-like proprotein convertase family protein
VLTAAVAALIIALAVPAGASAKTVTTKGSLTFSSPGPVTLPAMGPASLYPWNLFAFSMPGNTTSVEVTLNGLTHRRSTDLDALLVAPNGGRSVMFMSDVGDATDIPPPGVNVTFKDGATNNAPIGTPLRSGTYKPTNGIDTNPDAFASPAPAGPYSTTLGRFKGQNPNGIWSLYLVDDNGDPALPATGAVQSWALKVNSKLKTKVQKAKKRKKRSCKRFKSKKKRKKCRKKRKRRR